MQSCGSNIRLSEGRFAVLPKMKWCLVGLSSDKPHLIVSFQSPAVPGCSILTTVSAALAPGRSWDSAAADLVWLSLGLWDCGPLFPKDALHHLLQELVGLCSGCPCAVKVLAVRGELQAALPITEPPHNGSLISHFHRLQMLSERLFYWQCCCKKAFSVAAFCHQNDYFTVNQSWLKCRWRMTP